MNGVFTRGVYATYADIVPVRRGHVLLRIRGFTEFMLALLVKGTLIEGKELPSLV